MELKVSKQNIEDLFTKIGTNKFVVPQYQRLYSWGDDECGALWQDLIDFFDDTTRHPTDTFFLGTIVLCRPTGIDASSTAYDREIIDGQQRITSLLLLLRAFYNIVSISTSASKLKSDLGKIIWTSVDRVTGAVKDTTQVRIISNIATAKDNDVLRDILCGVATNAPDSNYQKNYDYFVQRVKDFSTSRAVDVLKLCLDLIERCCVVPIEADNMDAALTIFNTLNDRGLALTDADIIKSKVYGTCTTPAEQNAFIDKWKDFLELCANTEITADQYYLLYMFIHRSGTVDALKQSRESMRKYLTINKLLDKESVFKDVYQIAQFFYDLQGTTKSLETQKYLDVLRYIDNKNWRYILAAYYYFNKENATFNTDLEVFVKWLVARFTYELVLKLSNGMKLVLNTIKNIRGGKNYKDKVDMTQWSATTNKYIANKMEKPLICLDAYLNARQTDLLPRKWEIEHILPIQWSKTTYLTWTKANADKYIQLYGNKTAIEKKVNIKANNNVFCTKRTDADKYPSSKIANVMDLVALNTVNDWLPGNIDDGHGNGRENDFWKRITAFLTANV